MAIDATILTTLGEIATQQSAPTNKILAAVAMLLDYAALNPDTRIWYTASGTQLYNHSSALYLSVAKVKSCAGSFYFLSDKPIDLIQPTTIRPPHNGPLYVLCKILRNVMGSAAESETTAAYLNAQEAVPMIIAFE